MYAVIRAGGKQYRVAPGDVVRLEKLSTGTDGKVEFSDVLAGFGWRWRGWASFGRARGRSGRRRRTRRKDLVFHYKRKKQYKEARGHRQDYTAVRITEIAADGRVVPKLPSFPERTQGEKGRARRRSQTSCSEGRQEEGSGKESRSQEGRTEEKEMRPIKGLRTDNRELRTV